MRSSVVHDYAEGFAERTLAELEAMVPQYVAGSELLAGVLLAIERKKKAQALEKAERAERSFRTTYEQSERHHSEEIAAARPHARRAELWAVIAIVVSILALILPHVSSEHPLRIAATPTPSVQSNSSNQTTRVAPAAPSIPITDKITNTETPAPEKPEKMPSLE